MKKKGHTAWSSICRWSVFPTALFILFTSAHTQDEPAFDAAEAISSVLIGIAMSNGVEACPDEIESALNKLNTAALQAGETPPDNKSAIENVESAIDDLEAVVENGCDLDGDIANIMDDLAAMARAIAEPPEGGI